jgi:hypothetical protein
MHDAKSTGPGERSDERCEEVRDRTGVHQDDRFPDALDCVFKIDPTPSTWASFMTHGSATSGSKGSTEHPHRSMSVTLSMLLWDRAWPQWWSRS